MSKSSVPAGRRQLSRAHITFYRAVMEGVDARRAWDLYLAFEGDFGELMCTTTLGWVRQALIQEAVAAGQPGLIGLFRRDPRSVKASPKPSLEEFAERFGDAGDWSESELVEMWKEEYGDNDVAEARRERLGKRLREALTLLEKAPRRQPVSGDLVERWLAPALAEKLSAAGIKTLGAASAALAARQTPRWEEVPGVGAVWADRLRVWLDENVVIELVQPPSPALSKPAQPLVPLERFQPELPTLATAVAKVGNNSATTLVWPREDSPHGAAGQSLGNAIGARDDKHAIELWLAAKAENPNTLRSYRKNAERLLLWCYIERQTTFQTLTVEDCIHYRTWLNTLARKTAEEWEKAGWKIDATSWFGSRAARRDNENWRPFEKRATKITPEAPLGIVPLRPDTVVQDLLTVRALFEFLLRGHYVRVNPWDLIGKKASRAKLTTLTEQFVGRSLTTEQWLLLINGLRDDGTELERRLLLTLWLGYSCGLRAAEMLSLSLGSILTSTETWWLHVHGKGDHWRKVPLTSPARVVLLAYLASVGLDAATVDRYANSKEIAESGQPILRGQRGRRSDARATPTERLRYDGLYAPLKAHIKVCADELATRNPTGAAKFRRASTHWLRHTCATLALKDGVPLNGVQRLLGHSSLTITSTYVTAQDDELMAEMERFATRNQS